MQINCDYIDLQAFLTEEDKTCIVILIHPDDGKVIAQATGASLGLALINLGYICKSQEIDICSVP